MKQFFLFVSLIATTSLFSLSFDKMTEQEKKACGIEKLSESEKSALDTWITTSSKVDTSGEYTVEKVDDLGRTITLSNGMQFHIHGRSTKKTMAWKAGEKVGLKEPHRAKSFKITNKSKKQTVTGKEK